MDQNKIVILAFFHQILISHFRRQPTDFFFSKKNRQMKAGQNNKYDMTKVWLPCFLCLHCFDKIFCNLFQFRQFFPINLKRTRFALPNWLMIKRWFRNNFFTFAQSYISQVLAQINLVLLLFWATRAVLKISAILGVFLTCFHGEN